MSTRIRDGTGGAGDRGSPGILSRRSIAHPLGRQRMIALAVAALVVLFILLGRLG